MISFRKHALSDTGCSVSFLGGRGRRANPSPGLAALAVCEQCANKYLYEPQQKGAGKPRSGEHVADAQKESAPEAAGRDEKSGGDSKIPIRISRLETPDGPYIVATIGDFPADLDGRRQDFLGRDFFEHFAGDVLGIGDPDSGATLKMAMLPQEKDDRREGDFTFGGLSGHMIVLVQKRRVVVACSFAEDAAEPKLMAAIEKFAGARVAD